MNQLYKRLYPEERHDRLLLAALELARTVGYMRVTLEGIARQAGVTHGLVTHYLGRIDDVRDMLVQLAVDTEVVEVVAQGLAARHPAALAASTELQVRAVAYMTM